MGFITLESGELVHTSAIQLGGTKDDVGELSYNTPDGRVIKKTVLVRVSSEEIQSNRCKAYKLLLP